MTPGILQMSGETKKLKKEWLLFGGAVLAVVCLLGAGLSFQTLRARWVARGLHSTDWAKRWRISDKLKTFGMPGRLAMLRALDVAEEEIAEDIHTRLLGMLDDDLKGKRDVAPVVRAALHGMRDPGSFGRRCASIASVGWALRLLDDAAKKEIIRRCLKIEFTAHPAYPPGDVGPRMWVSITRMSDSVRLKYVVECRSEDGEWSESREGDFGGSSGSYSRALTSVPELPGKCIVRSKVKVTLARAGFVDLPRMLELAARGEDYKETVPKEDEWSAEFELDPVSFKVDDHLPADYLQAKVTPEVEAMVKSAMSVRLHDVNFAGSWDDGECSIGYQSHLVEVTQALPCDLACRPRWYVVEMDKTFDAFDGQDMVWLVKGEWMEEDFGVERFIEKTKAFLDEPDGFLESIPKLGEQQFTIRITLEPSFRAALRNPDVKAYWPKPIELPEFIMKVNVQEAGDRVKAFDGRKSNQEIEIWP